MKKARVHKPVLTHAHDLHRRLDLNTRFFTICSQLTVETLFDRDSHKLR